jgi:hypothetical protein
MEEGNPYRKAGKSIAQKIPLYPPFVKGDKGGFSGGHQQARAEKLSFIQENSTDKYEHSPRQE